MDGKRHSPRLRREKKRGTMTEDQLEEEKQDQLEQGRLRCEKKRDAMTQDQLEEEKLRRKG